MIFFINILLKYNTYHLPLISVSIDIFARSSVLKDPFYMHTNISVFIISTYLQRSRIHRNISIFILQQYGKLLIYDITSFQYQMIMSLGHWLYFTYTFQKSFICHYNVIFYMLFLYLLFNKIIIYFIIYIKNYITLYILIHNRQLQYNYLQLYFHVIDFCVFVIHLFIDLKKKCKINFVSCKLQTHSCK